MQKYTDEDIRKMNKSTCKVAADYLGIWVLNGATVLYGRDYSSPGGLCIRIMADTCILRGKYTNYSSVFY